MGIEVIGVGVRTGRDRTESAEYPSKELVATGRRNYIGMWHPDALYEVDRESEYFLHGHQVGGKGWAGSDAYKSDVLARNVTEEQYKQLEIAFKEADDQLKYHQHRIQELLYSKYTQILGRDIDVRNK